MQQQKSLMLARFVTIIAKQFNLYIVATLEDYKEKKK